MNPARRFDLLIFDLDGTLVDTREDLTNAVNYALRRLGKPELDVDTVTNNVGDGVRKLIERTFDVQDPELLERGRDYFVEYYQQHLADHTRPYPGIREMLEALRDRKLAVVSNKSQEFTVPLLERLDLARYFEVILGARAGYPPKPDPAAIEAILEKTGVAPQRALIIGDSGNDIRAGKAAGVATCAVTYGYRPADELETLAPDWMVDRPEDIVTLLQKVEEGH